MSVLHIVTADNKKKSSLLLCTAGLYQHIGQDAFTARFGSHVEFNEG